MDLDKQDLISDALVNLYRSAYCLAKGSKTGIDFYHKAQSVLGPSVLIESISEDLISDEKQRLSLAEKILDIYHKLKHSYVS